MKKTIVLGFIFMWAACASIQPKPIVDCCVDTYPPGGNGISDVCECEGDFDCNGRVDTEDMVKFMADFGRSFYVNPCTNDSPCNGDFDCDRNVDIDDQAVFKEDYGRNRYVNPCPKCEAGKWCEY